jgi:hypothetical protein
VKGGGEGEEEKERESACCSVRVSGSVTDHAELLYKCWNGSESQVE